MKKFAICAIIVALLLSVACSTSNDTNSEDNNNKDVAEIINARLNSSFYAEFVKAMYEGDKDTDLTNIFTKYKVETTLANNLSELLSKIEDNKNNFNISEIGYNVIGIKTYYYFEATSINKTQSTRMLVYLEVNKGYITLIEGRPLA